MANYYTGEGAQVNWNLFQPPRQSYANQMLNYERFWTVNDAYVSKTVRRNTCAGPYWTDDVYALKGANWIITYFLPCGAPYCRHLK